MEDTKEKYLKTPVLELKEIAKNRGVKQYYRYKKSELAKILSELDANGETVSTDEITASGGKKDSADEKKDSADEKKDSADEKKEADVVEKPKKKRGRPKKIRTEEDTEKKPRRKYKKRAGKKSDASENENKISAGSSAAENKQPDPEKNSNNISTDVSNQNTENVNEDGENGLPAAAGRDELREPAESLAFDNRPVIEENKEVRERKFHDGRECVGILEVMQEGFGFIRSDNYMPGENDIYVSHSQIRKFNLKTGDMITGVTRKNNSSDKYGALLFISDVNGCAPEDMRYRTPFEDMVPVFPDERIRLEIPGGPVATRIVDLFSPIGKGQRGMIVSQPKAGKTTLLKQIAKSVKTTHPEIHIIVLLIDERPEEVTDMKEQIEGDNVEVIYSTFDELPEHHKRVSEMAIERAKRLVEQGRDVMILLDSITRLSRAYNLTVPPSGKTLSGGLDPMALHMPKRFFGAARNIRNGGSLTILATALVNTGSKMDDVVYEEFKGTGNMELVLDRKLSEKRVFPAIDLVQSGTRRDDLLLNDDEMAAMEIIHRSLNGMKRDEATEDVLNTMMRTRSNEEFVKLLLRSKKPIEI